MKEILLSGKNPFTPYFIVLPRASTFASIDTLRDNISRIAEVEEVRFDAALVELVTRLDRFISLYRMALIAGLCAGFLIAAARLIRAWYSDELIPLDLVYSVISGAMAGVSGAGMFYLLSYHLVPFQGIQLTAPYYPYLVTAGLVITMLWEN